MDAAARPLDGKAISAALHAASRAHVLGSAQVGDKLDDGSGSSGGSADSSVRGGTAMGSDKHRPAGPAPQDSGVRQASGVPQDAAGARTAGRAVANTDSVRARRASAELPQSEEHPLQPDMSNSATDTAAGRLQSQGSRSRTASPVYDSKRTLLPPRDASGASTAAAAATANGSRTASGEPGGSQPAGAAASSRARERGRRSTMDSGVVSSLLEGGRAAMSGLSGRRPTASPVVPLRSSVDAGATAEALADTVMANLVARFGKAAAAGAGGTSGAQQLQQQGPDPALVLGRGGKLLSGRKNKSIGSPGDDVAAAEGAPRSLQQARRASFSVGMPMPPGQRDLWASRLPSVGRPAAAAAPVDAAAVAGSASTPPLSSASSDTDDSPFQQQQGLGVSQPSALGPSFSMQERIPSGTSGQLRGPLAARPASFVASPRGTSGRPTRFHPGGGTSLHEHVPQQQQQLTLPPQQPPSADGSGNEVSTHGQAQAPVQARAEVDGGLALPMPPAAAPPGANVGSASDMWDAGRDASPPPVAQGMRVPMSRGAPAIEALPQVRLTTARGRRPPHPTTNQAAPVPQQSQQLLQQQAQEGERRLEANRSGALAAPSAEQSGQLVLPGPDPSLPGSADHRPALNKAWGTMQPVRADTDGSAAGRAPLSRNPTLGSRHDRALSRNASMHWATAVGRTLSTPAPQLDDESTERQLQLLDQELDQEDASSRPQNQLELQQQQQHRTGSGTGSGASPARAAATLTGSGSPSDSPAEDAAARINSGTPGGPGPVAEATEEPQQAQPQQQQPQGPSTRVPAALALHLDGHIDSVPSTPMAGETTRGTGMSPYSPGPGTRGTYVSVSQLDQLDSHYVDSPGVQEVLRQGGGGGGADGGAGGAMFNARARPSAAALRYAWVTRGVLALTAHLEVMLTQLREAIAEVEVRYKA